MMKRLVRGMGIGLVCGEVESENVFVSSVIVSDTYFIVIIEYINYGIILIDELLTVEDCGPIRLVCCVRLVIF